ALAIFGSGGATGLCVAETPLPPPESAPHFRPPLKGEAKRGSNPLRNQVLSVVAAHLCTDEIAGRGRAFEARGREAWEAADVFALHQELAFGAFLSRQMSGEGVGPTLPEPRGAFLGDGAGHLRHPRGRRPLLRREREDVKEGEAALADDIERLLEHL